MNLEKTVINLKKKSSSIAALLNVNPQTQWPEWPKHCKFTIIKRQKKPVWQNFKINFGNNLNSIPQKISCGFCFGELIIKVIK